MTTTQEVVLGPALSAAGIINPKIEVLLWSKEGHTLSIKKGP